MFEAVYRHCHQDLYCYVRSIVRDSYATEDVLQTVMVKALAALQCEQRDFELRPWLFRIAHNEAINHFRRERPTVELDGATDSMALPLSELVDQHQQLQQLWADLADLSEHQRQALVLRELNGLGHLEISQVVGSTAKAVKQSIFEARQALLQCAEGRSMPCDDIQRALSDGDGRARRGRRMRAHLAGCASCRAFDSALGARPAQLAALSPILPAAASASLLAHLLSGTHAGAVATGSGGASAGLVGGSLTGALTSKVAIAVAVAAVAAGTTSAVVTHAVHHPSRPSTRPGLAPTLHAVGAGARTRAPSAAALNAGGAVVPHLAGRPGGARLTQAAPGAGSAAALHATATAASAPSGPAAKWLRPTDHPGGRNATTPSQHSAAVSGVHHLPPLRHVAASGGHDRRTTAPRITITHRPIAPTRRTAPQTPSGGHSGGPGPSTGTGAAGTGTKAGPGKGGGRQAASTTAPSAGNNHAPTTSVPTGTSPGT